ncbi:MAG: hypothetical protein HY907_16190 [Deltaproteobacteria bacterium]|nr:hypothetical protein [Deltaproteobacteria bacterium]
MKLKPLRMAVQAKYPSLVRNAWRGALVAASMTATSLGGCGPGLDSRYVDSAMNQGDLDGTVDDCDSAENPEACREGR